MSERHLIYTTYPRAGIKTRPRVTHLVTEQVNRLVYTACGRSFATVDGLNKLVAEPATPPGCGHCRRVEKRQ